MHVLVSRVVAPTRVCDARTRRQTARAARLRQQSTPARARAGTDASEPEGPAGDAAITRRDAVARSVTAVAAVVAGVALANADAAFAKDLKEMEAEKAARKAALRAAAEASAKSGRGEAAFDDAAYGVSEDARTPNAHSRQEEGLKEALRNNV
jgi:phage gp16-like protein